MCCPCILVRTEFFSFVIFRLLDITWAMLALQYLFDGGLTDNIPVLNKDTITVSPWAGEHSICPRDSYGQTFPLTVVNTSICPTGSNLVRFNDAFNPPTQEFLKRYCWQGYDACLTFLAENGKLLLVC